MSYNYSILDSINIPNIPFIPNTDKLIQLSGGDLGVGKSYLSNKGILALDDNPITKFERTLFKTLFDVSFKPISVISIFPKVLAKAEDIIALSLTTFNASVTNPLNNQRSLNYKLYSNTKSYNENISTIKKIDTNNTNIPKYNVNDNSEYYLDELDLSKSNYKVLNIEYSTGYKIDGIDYKYIYRILPTTELKVSDVKIDINSTISKPSVLIFDVFDENYNTILDINKIPNFIKNTNKFYNNITDSFSYSSNIFTLRDSLLKSNNAKLKNMNVNNDIISSINDNFKSNLTDILLTKLLESSYISRLRINQIPNRYYNNKYVNFNNTNIELDIENDYILQLFEVKPCLPNQRQDYFNTDNPYGIWYDGVNIIDNNIIPNLKVTDIKYSNRMISPNNKTIFYDPFLYNNVIVFESARKYNIDDIVAYNNQYYICIQSYNGASLNTTNNVPILPNNPNYWRIFNFKSYFLLEGVYKNNFITNDSLKTPSLNPNIKVNEYPNYTIKDIVSLNNKYQELLIDLFVYAIPELSILLQSIKNPSSIIYESIFKNMKINFDMFDDISQDIFNIHFSSNPKNSTKNSRKNTVRKYVNIKNKKPFFSFNSSSSIVLFNNNINFGFFNGTFNLIKNIDKSIYTYTNSMINILLKFITMPFIFIEKIINKIIDFIKKISVTNIQTQIEDLLSFKWLQDFFNPLYILSIIGITINLDKLNFYKTNKTDFIDLSEILDFSFSDKLPIVTRKVFDFYFGEDNVFINFIKNTLSFIFDFINEVLKSLIQIFNLPENILFPSKIDISSFL